jgi:branched-chain amino acid transport system permease protein
MIETTAGMKATAPRKSRARVAALKARFGRQNWILVIILFALLLLFPALPFVEGWMAYQATLVIIYIMAAQGVSILTGYTGLVTVGHGGFLAIGAYTSALLTQYQGIDLITGMIAGGIMAAIFGCVLGLIFLRLAGAFMAIGTLGFAFFIGAIVNNVPIFEGRTGISLPPNNIFGLFEIEDFGFYYVSLVTLALVTLFIYGLVRSGVGRAFKALRDDEKAAQSSGVNRLFYRTLAFSISAFVTGVAGALNGHSVNYISAEVYGDIWYSVDLLVAAVVGGSAMLMGPFIGGFFVAMVPYFFEELRDFAFILKGVVLIAVLLFASAGVAEALARPFKAIRRRKLAEAGAHLQAVGEPAMSAGAGGGSS